MACQTRIQNQFLSHSPSAGQAGIAIAEALIGVAITVLALSLLAPVFVSQLAQSRRIAGQEAVEAAVSRDLSWLRNYAKVWRLASGPYSVTAAQADIAAAPVNSSFTRYAPTAPGVACPVTLISDFIAAAGSAGAASLTPVRPNPIPPATETAQNIPLNDGAASDYQLNRIITFAAASTANPENLNRFQVRYVATSATNRALAFNRQASIVVEAAAWCPS